MVVILVIAVDMAWLSTSFVSLDDKSWLALTAVCLSAASLVIIAHLQDMGSRAYTLLTGLSITLALWPALKILNYITMSFPLPLADERLASWDAVLGFDWLSYIAWLDKDPLLISLMSLTYGSLIQYCCIAFLVLLLVKGAERAREFVCLFVISAVFTIGVGPVFPAQGAMIYYAPDAASFEVINTAMGTYFWPPLSEIRGSSQLDLVVTNLPGLVAFPSFHTAMGVILIYASRGSVAILLPSLAFNLVMIASTPLFGGHYLVDVIAGVMTAVGAIIIYERFGRRTILDVPASSALSYDTHHNGGRSLPI